MKLLPLLFSLLLMTCHTKTISDEVVIEVVLNPQQAEKLKSGYLYLYDIHKRVTIDSVRITGVVNKFIRKAEPSFTPQLVVLKHLDTFKNFSYYRPLGFQNPYHEKWINSTFYMDRGTTKILAYYNNKTYPSTFSGSKQNEPLFRNIQLTHAENDPLDDAGMLQKNIDLIKKHPFSIEFLNQLFNHKNHFSNASLKVYLSYFDDNIKKIPLYKSFDNYFVSTAEFDKKYLGSFKMQDTKGLYQSLENKHAAYHLFVFWASWCGPCREEIPQLKKSWKAHQRNGLAITSISLDSDQTSWKTALRQEQMPWPQFIAIDSTKDLLDLHYNIKLIPKAYLFDKDKKLVAKFEGNEGAIEKKLQSLFNRK